MTSIKNINRSKPSRSHAETPNDSLFRSEEPSGFHTQRTKGSVCTRHPASRILTAQLAEQTLIPEVSRLNQVTGLC